MCPRSKKRGMKPLIAQNPPEDLVRRVKPQAQCLIWYLLIQTLHQPPRWPSGLRRLPCSRKQPWKSSRFCLPSPGRYSSREFNNLDCFTSRMFIQSPGWRNHCPLFCHLFRSVQSFLSLSLYGLTNRHCNSVFPIPEAEVSGSLSLSAKRPSRAKWSKPAKIRRELYFLPRLW